MIDMPRPNTRLQLQMSRSSNNTSDGSPEFRLTITDVTSGLTFVEATLDAEAFADLMSTRTTGSVEGVPAWLLDNPGRQSLGQYEAHVYRRMTSMEAVNDRLAETWADTTMRVLGASVVQGPRRDNNHGFRFTFRHYLPSQREADLWTERTQKVLDRLAAPIMVLDQASQLAATLPSDPE